MATPPVIADRGDLQQQIQSIVGPGNTPQPYTQGVLGINGLLHSSGVPLPTGFGNTVVHNVTLVENGQVSSPTAHLMEVRPLFNASVDHFKSGNYANSAICLSGAIANLTVAPMLSGSAQKSNMNIGKF